MSRKVVAHLFSSANGVVESPNLWQFGAFGAQEAQLMTEVLATATDAVLGRKLWEEWSQYWPEADDPFAQWINPVRKHVLSETVGNDLTWNSTRIVGDPVEYIKNLREEGEGDISVCGGIETVRSLFVKGLIDELILTMHPVVTNEGRRLFDESISTTRLNLLGAMPTDSGNVILRYGLRKSE